MATKQIVDIPISEIRIVNPRTRDKQGFAAIVSSIKTVGLKKPVTVTKRPMAEDGTQYDLVCGQGRLQAYLALGQSEIPANVVEATKEDRYVMGLVENIARQPPSSKDLFREVLCLKGRGYCAKEIAGKLGRDMGYISDIIRLIDRDEGDLVEAVETRRLPISIALIIASAEESDVQEALSQAYESGELRGLRLLDAKRIIATHAAKQNPGESKLESKFTGRTLVREYQRRAKEQQRLIKQAARTRDTLLMLKSVLKTLLSDEQFLVLLRTEGLQDVPHELVQPDLEK